MKKKIGFIGLGSMASAMIGGMLRKKLVEPEDILGNAKTEKTRLKAKEAWGITILHDNAEVAREADIVVLAVKPQFFEEVIEELQGLGADAWQKKLLISLAPGKTMEWFEKSFGFPVPMIRCMPNTPALVGEGCTAVSLGKEAAKPENADVVKESLELIESFGEAVVMPERLIDIAGQIGGASIAWLCLAMEGMADGAVAEGMPRDMAYKFAAAAMAGTGRLALSTGQHPGVLKDMVTSPAGTTIQGNRILEERAVRGAFMDAVIESTERSRRM